MRTPSTTPEHSAADFRSQASIGSQTTQSFPVEKIASTLAAAKIAFFTEYPPVEKKSIFGSNHQTGGKRLGTIDTTLQNIPDTDPAKNIYAATLMLAGLANGEEVPKYIAFRAIESGLVTEIAPLKTDKLASYTSSTISKAKELLKKSLADNLTQAYANDNVEKLKNPTVLSSLDKITKALEKPQDELTGLMPTWIKLPKKIVTKQETDYVTQTIEQYAKMQDISEELLTNTVTNQLSLLAKLTFRAKNIQNFELADLRSISNELYKALTIFAETNSSNNDETSFTELLYIQFMLEKLRENLEQKAIDLQRIKMATDNKIFTKIEFEALQKLESEVIGTVTSIKQQTEIVIKNQIEKIATSLSSHEATDSNTADAPTKALNALAEAIFYAQHAPAYLSDLAESKISKLTLSSDNALESSVLENAITLLSPVKKVSETPSESSKDNTGTKSIETLPATAKETKNTDDTKNPKEAQDNKITTAANNPVNTAASKTASDPKNANTESAFSISPFTILAYVTNMVSSAVTSTKEITQFFRAGLNLNIDNIDDNRLSFYDAPCPPSTTTSSQSASSQDNIDRDNNSNSDSENQNSSAIVTRSVTPSTQQSDETPKATTDDDNNQNTPSLPPLVQKLVDKINQALQFRQQPNASADSGNNDNQVTPISNSLQPTLFAVKSGAENSNNNDTNKNVTTSPSLQSSGTW